MTPFCDRHPLLDADELATAAALWAAALPDPSACGGGRIVVPRFPLRDLLSGDAGAGAGLASLLARHSFVVLTLDAGQMALAEPGAVRVYVLHALTDRTKRPPSYVGRVDALLFNVRCHEPWRCSAMYASAAWSSARGWG